MVALLAMSFQYSFLLMVIRTIKILVVLVHRCNYVIACGLNWMTSLTCYIYRALLLPEQNFSGRAIVFPNGPKSLPFSPFIFSLISLSHNMLSLQNFTYNFFSSHKAYINLHCGFSSMKFRVQLTKANYDDMNF